LVPLQAPMFAIAARLKPDYRLHIAAPFGLADLFALRLAAKPPTLVHQLLSSRLGTGSSPASGPPPAAPQGKETCQAGQERCAGRQDRGHHCIVHGDVFKGALDHPHHDGATEQGPTQQKQHDERHSYTASPRQHQSQTSLSHQINGNRSLVPN
jgi:hypothetical protein